MSDTGMNESMEPLANPDDEQQHLPEEATPAPGAQLAAYRKERGWSIEEVANQLNLAPRQIQAIEDDNYKALPPIAVVRGFVRAYAKLLKVDPTPMLAVMGNEPAPFAAPPATRRVAGATFAEPRFPEITDRRGPSGKQLAIAAGVVVVAVAGWAAWRAGVLTSMSEKVGGGLQRLSRAAGDAVQSAPDSREAAAPDEDPASTVESSTTGSVVAEPAAPVAPPVSEPAAATKAAPKETGPSKGALAFSAREDAWIEVTATDDNRVVFSRLLKAGESVSVPIHGPRLVVIGNASAIDATYRGEPLTLKPNKRSNVARFNVK